MRLRQAHLQAVVQVVAGLALNIFPAIFIAIYARVAPIDDQGFLALSLAVGVYVAQLLNAFVVEGRLATPEADHNLSLPGWAASMSIVAGALLVWAPAVVPHAVLLVSSIGLMTGLLMSRTIGVVTGRWKREAFAATVLIAASTVALVLSATELRDHSVRLLAAGAVCATLTRYWPRSRTRGFGMPPDVRRSSWVTAETAVVGIVQPAMTSIVLVVMGPAASVAFRVISTVSGALEPILSYGRYRLLAHGHKGELATFGAVFVAGMVAVIVGAFSGLGSLIFGPAWDDVGVVAFLLACLWKGFMLLSTVPFAALRKAGETALVFRVRALSTVIYLAIGVVFLVIWHSTAAIFLAFVLAELITTLVYHYAATRGAPEYRESFGAPARSAPGEGRGDGDH
ncbi:hypothetical protein ACQI4L_11280 [Mycolicibacterium litorale]|uniref:hypothetical protein n=1 Tax=Mycolicibacterium litorale TaxID=758802 RepID=UPI003CF7A913